MTQPHTREWEKGNKICKLAKHTQKSIAKAGAINQSECFFCATLGQRTPTAGKRKQKFNLRVN
jgi:hypothetical protein